MAASALMDCAVCTPLGCVLIAVAIIYYIYTCLTVGNYDQRYVFITGCDMGFGNLLAKQLTSMGFNVFAGCLTEKGVSELKQLGNEKLKPLQLDVTKKEDIEKSKIFVEKSLPKGKGLWALVNNAGILGPLAFIDCYKREDYEKVLSVNLYGTIETTMAFLPLLRQAKGRIVNVASVAGIVSLPTCIPYNISKYGVEAFSDGLRRVLSGQNVSVHMLEPGLHGTQLLDEAAVQKGMYRDFKAAPQEVQEYYGEKCFEFYSWFTCKLISVLTSTRLEQVIKAHTHAITARSPKTRYLVGYDANLLFWPLKIMPTWMSDFILKVRYIEPIQHHQKKNS